MHRKSVTQIFWFEKVCYQIMNELAIFWLHIPTRCVVSMTPVLLDPLLVFPVVWQSMVSRTSDYPLRIHLPLQRTSNPKPTLKVGVHFIELFID